METNLFTRAQLEAIKCALAQEKTLSDADWRLRQPPLNMFNTRMTDEQIHKAHRWGLYDGYHHQFRAYTLGGIVGGVTKMSLATILEAAYSACYEIGKQLKEEENRDASL